MYQHVSHGAQLGSTVWSTLSCPKGRRPNPFGILLLPIPGLSCQPLRVEQVQSLGRILLLLCHLPWSAFWQELNPALLSQKHQLMDALSSLADIMADIMAEIVANIMAASITTI